MLMAGRNCRRAIDKVLTVVAKQAAGLVRQHELAEEAGRPEAIARADELRRSLLSAVNPTCAHRWLAPRRRCQWTQR